MAKSQVNLKDLQGRSFTTPVGRMSFPALLTPKKYKGKEDATAYYQTAILFPKDQDLTEMRREIKLAAAEKFGKDPKKWPKISMPWRDGDKQEDLKGYENHWFVNAKSKRKVKIVDGKKQPVTDEEEIYGGRYCKLALRAKLTTTGAKDEEGNVKYFVSLYLQAVQVLTVDGDKGDAFGGGVNIDDVFDTEDTSEDDNDDLKFDADSDDDGDELTM